jgi:hypothetical protein
MFCLAAGGGGGGGGGVKILGYWKEGLYLMDEGMAGGARRYQAWVVTDWKKGRRRGESS